MNEQQFLELIQKAKEIGALIGHDASRAQLTFDDFNQTDPSKMRGNLEVIILNALKDVSGNITTPMLGALETKPSRSISSTTFDMHTEALDTAAASSYKLGETSAAYNPTNTFARKTNSMMTMGVAVSVNMMARIVAAVPGVSDIGTHKIQRALQNLSIAKEYYLFNGNKINSNETDGILTILARENSASNTATSFTYAGPTGTNVTQRKHIEQMLYSAIFSNGADPMNLLIWACYYVMQTVAEWYDDKLMYTTPQLFQFFGDTPVYQSQIGKKIPMVNFNEGKVANVDDKLLLLDMSELGLVRLDGLTTMVDMPKTYAMDELHKVVIDSLGLNFLHTMTSGFISGIDKA